MFNPPRVAVAERPVAVETAPQTGSAPSIIQSVEGLRALAAILVLLFHVLYGSGRPELGDGFLRNVMLSGYMGVDFFFVLSGFLLFLPTVKASGRFGDVRAYMVRRGARILPAYYIALGVGLLVAPLLTTVDVDLPRESAGGLASFLLHLTLLQHSVGLLLGFPEGFYINGGVWTLALEACFYLLLPLFAARYFRHPFRWLAACLGASMLWKYAVINLAVFGRSTPGSSLRLTLITQFPTYLAHFGGGMTAAWLLVRLGSHPSYPARRWIAVPIQVLALGAIGWGMSRAGARDIAGSAGVFDHWSRTTLVAGAFAVLLLATALGPAWSQLPFSNPVSRKLGQVSYGIYLWHLPLIGFALTTLGFAPDATTGAFWRLLGFVLAGSVVLGLLSFKLVEKPAIDWARCHKNRNDGRPAGPPPAVGRTRLVFQSRRAETR